MWLSDLFERYIYWCQNWVGLMSSSWWDFHNPKILFLLIFTLYMHPDPSHYFLWLSSGNIFYLNFFVTTRFHSTFGNCLLKDTFHEIMTKGKQKSLCKITTAHYQIFCLKKNIALLSGFNTIVRIFCCQYLNIARIANAVHCQRLS